MLLVTGVYCVVGGMYSVVMNDLIQFVLKVIAAVGIAVIAIVLIRPEQIMAAVPAGWDHLFFGWKLDLDWSHADARSCNDTHLRPGQPRAATATRCSCSSPACSSSRACWSAWPGPTPNYAIQHILSTRSPREAALENMVMAVVSLAPRFLLIARHRRAGHRLLQPGPGRDGRRQGRTSRRSCPASLSRVCAHRLQGHSHRGACWPRS